MAIDTPIGLSVLVPCNRWHPCSGCCGLIETQPLVTTNSPKPPEHGSHRSHGNNTDKQQHHAEAGTNPTGRGATGSSLSSSAGASNLYSTGVTNRAISVLDTSPPMITHASGEYSPDP
jgi:hypothetical protein